MERCAGDAIGCAAYVAGGISRPRVTTHDIAARAARIVRIVHTKFRMVENIEGLSPEFKLGGLSDLENLASAISKFNCEGLFRKFLRHRRR